MEEDFRKNEMRDFYKTYKKHLTKYQPPSLCFESEENNLVLTNKTNCEMLARYFDKLLNFKMTKGKLDFRNLKTQRVTNLQMQMK